MRTLPHTQAIFRQLAQTDGPANLTVKTTIENHDAWLRNADTQAAITAALRVRLAHGPRPESVNHRIRVQRNALSRLITQLPVSLSSTG